MVYKEYMYYETKYLKAQKVYDEVCEEKARLFNRTQPSAMKYDKDKIDGGMASNTFDDYLIKKEQTNIDNRLAEAWIILEDRGKLLKIKEKELRESKNIYDKIYRMHNLDSLNGYKISMRIHYSVAQVYRIIGAMDKEIERMRQNETKDTL